MWLPDDIALHVISAVCLDHSSVETVEDQGAEEAAWGLPRERVVT